MKQYSSEAEELQIEEARLQALYARREKIKQSVISVLVVTLYAIVYFNHAEINDTVAKLFSSDEPEYQSILALSDEVDAENSGDESVAGESNDRKGKLKNALRQAKQHAAYVDGIMDDAPVAAEVKKP